MKEQKAGSDLPSIHSKTISNEVVNYETSTSATTTTLTELFNIKTELISKTPMTPASAQKTTSSEIQPNSQFDKDDIAYDDDSSKKDSNLKLLTS